jgi:hypothetical protein
MYVGDFAGKSEVKRRAERELQLTVFPSFCLSVYEGALFLCARATLFLLF